VGRYTANMRWGEEHNVQSHSSCSSEKIHTKHKKYTPMGMFLMFGRWGRGDML